MKGKAKKPKDPANAIDMVGFLDYCVVQRFEAAELTSYFFPPDADDEYFLEIKRQAFLRGVTISGTAIGNNFTQAPGQRLDQDVRDAKKWIDRAAIMGAPHIRFFAGTGRELDDHPDRIEQAIEKVRDCAEYAQKNGVFIGVENHGRLRPEQLLEIIHGVNHPWVGINLDTGNFISDDPYRDLEQCVDYAVNVQVKTSMRRPDGTKYPADLDRVAGILKSSGFQGFVILEYEDEAPFAKIPSVSKTLRDSLGI